MSDFMERYKEKKKKEEAEYAKQKAQIERLNLSEPLSSLLESLVDPPCCECCDSRSSVQDLLREALKKMKLNVPARMSVDYCEKCFNKLLSAREDMKKECLVICDSFTGYNTPEDSNDDSAAQIKYLIEKL